jgi:glucokinase
MKYLACFDIGGSYIKYALIDENGTMYEKGKETTPKNNTQEEIAVIIIAIVKLFQSTFPVTSIGISSCGLIDSEIGEVILSSNIPNYTGMKLSEEIYKQTGLPVTVENDVRSACIGEMWRGAGGGKRNIVLLTLGTGIGSGIIIDGKMIKGSRGLAGELGHIVIVHNGLECGCGGKGCYERYASTSAFIRQYIEEAKKDGIQFNEISGEEVMIRVKQQEARAVKVYKQFVQYIATGLISIAHLLNPEAIIIGGGIAEEGEEFIQDVRLAFREGSMSLYHSTNILTSQLRNDASLYGACYLGIKKR